MLRTRQMSTMVGGTTGSLSCDWRLLKLQEVCASTVSLVTSKTVCSTRLLMPSTPLLMRYSTLCNQAKTSRLASARAAAAVASHLDQATDNGAIIVTVVLQTAAQLHVLAAAVSTALERGIELQRSLNAAQAAATVLGALRVWNL